MRGLVAALDVAVLSTWFFSIYFIELLPTALAGSALFILLAGYLAIIWLIYPPGRLRLQLDRASLVACAAGAVYVVFTYEPVLVVHSVLLPVGAAAAATTLAYYALFGVFLQSFLFNLNARSLFNRQSPGAVALPFFLYLILLLPLSTVSSYAIASSQEILTFVIVSLFGGAVLFVVLLMLYAKSKFNNLPGIVFYAAAAIPNVFSFLIAANLILVLVWLFAALGVVIVLVEFVLPATWVEKRLFPAARRTTSRSTNRATFATIGAIGAIAVTLFLVVPAVLGTPHPYYADATGSMAPEIEPGSLLIVRHVSLSSISVGEVLVFNAPWSPGLTVAHEVIAVLHTSTGLEFRTRGIANPGPDPIPVPAANVFGIVALVVPWVGYVVLYVYLVAILTAVAVGAYVVYSVAYPRRQHVRRYRTLF